jgi:type II secretory pathway component PulF
VFSAINKNAAFLRNFATLLDAGVTPVEAVKSLQEKHDTQSTQLNVICQGLGQGESIAHVLEKSKLLEPHTIALIKIAEQAGKITLSLKFIAQQVEKHQSRMQQLKHKLWLPWVLLIIAVFASVLLQALSNSFTLADLSSSLFPLLFVAFATWLFFLFLQTSPLYWLSLLWGSALIKSIRYLRWLFEYNWFTQLLWQTETGINYESAIKNSAGLLNSPRYQRDIRHCQQLLKQGNSLSSALEQSHLLISIRSKQILQSAEYAGRLESGIKHQLALREASLEQATSFIFEWLPRIYYLLIIVIIGGYLL